MDYINLGRTGLKISRLCLGAMTYGSKRWREWVLEEEESRPFIRRALELGINFFDTADIYSLGVSEEILGRALRDFGGSRDKVVVATKVFNPMGDGPSLRRLGMDYVDLYQIHRFDPETPIEETLQALDDVVRMGKARYLGASSMFAWQFARMLYKADEMGLRRFVAMQNHYNVIYREEEREMLPLCRAEGIGVIPWSPLARGFVAGDRRAGNQGDTSRARSDSYAHDMYYQPSDFAMVERIGEVARARGVSNAQVALAWILGRPGVTAPIVGASKMAHLEELVAAAGMKLEPAEVAVLDACYQPHRVLGHS
jgi:aryl-alcohol dehydrogenase (NADP+)